MTLEILFINMRSTQLPDGFAEGLQSLGCHLRNVDWGPKTVSALRSCSPDIVVVRHDGTNRDDSGHMAALRHIAGHAGVILAHHGAFGSEVWRLLERSSLTLSESDLDNYLRFYARIFEHLTAMAPWLIQDPFDSGQIVVGSQDHRVSAGQHSVHLRGREFALLDFLARRPDRWFTRAQLISAVWHGEPDIDERTVDVLVMRLRRALAPLGAAGMIATRLNKGYGFRSSMCQVRTLPLQDEKSAPHISGIRAQWPQAQPSTA